MSISKNIAREIVIPTNIIAIDLYLQCRILELGKKVAYCDEAVVWFKPASTMLDFASQVVRALQGHEEILEYIERSHIKPSSSLLIKETMKEALRDPSGMLAVALCYTLLPLYKKKVAENTNSLWRISESSKGLNFSDL